MKKLIALILALSLSASLVISAGAITEEAAEESGAWEALYANVYGDGGELLREDYAGAWVDPNRENYLYIGLTPDADMDFYRGVLAGCSDYEFVMQKYPLKALDHMRDVVMERHKELFGGGGVYQSENLIGFDVTVSKEQEGGRIAAEMAKIQQEEGLPEGIETAFSIRYGVSISVVDDVEVEISAEGKGYAEGEERVG